MQFARKHLFLCCLLTAGVTLCGLSSAAWSATRVMTFDGQSGQLRTSYTEDGVTATNITENYADFVNRNELRIASQAGNHFRFETGKLFNMLSVRIINVTGIWMFTSNKGGVHVIASNGVLDFKVLGPLWQAVLQIDLKSSGDGELNTILDDFTVEDAVLVAVEDVQWGGIKSLYR